MQTVGLDIGTYSLKAVELKKHRGVAEVVKVAEGPNYLGRSLPSDDATTEKLTQQIEAFLADHSLSTQDLRLALPESTVSTKVIQIPQLNDAELASAIGWQAEQHIPIPKEDLSLEYQVLYRPERGEKETPMRVLLVGTRRSMVDKVVSLFTNLGIEPSFMETQTLSLLRSTALSPQDPPTLIAHIGFSTMDMAVVRGGELSFVFSHSQGGILLTRALENLLQLPTAQAEEYKRSYGLDAQFFEGKVQQALIPAVQPFTDQLFKSMNYFANQFTGEKIQRILLSGGSAHLPGLVTYLASTLGAEVFLVSPFAQGQGAIPETNQASFTVAMGLALRHE